MVTMERKEGDALKPGPDAEDETLELESGEEAGKESIEDPGDDLPEFINSGRGRGSMAHKDLVNAKTLDATQLYLNEIGFSPLLTAEGGSLLLQTGVAGQ